MREPMIKLAPGFSLPIDVAGETIAVLGKRGGGKTNTATVLVEELVAANVQTVIVDPVGAWWGIRSSATGEKGAGLGVPILGGQHGDVPLEQTAGSLIADVVVDSGQSLLLDLSDFSTKAGMERFVWDFADRLYRRKARASSLLHLVLEEADVFAPQSPKGGWSGDGGKMAAAIEAIVRRGRSRGIGVTLITQRSAVLNKDVLTQADVLIAMRTTGPQDVKAIKAWVDAQGDDEGKIVVDSLPSLSTGEAWVWNPERDLRERVKVRRRRTYDSSATPKAGQIRAEPQETVAIDLSALGAQIQATVERVKATDPAALRKRVQELERELGGQPRETVVETVTETIEVSVLTDDDRYLLSKYQVLGEVALDQWRADADSLERLLLKIGDVLKQPAVQQRKEAAPVRVPTHHADPVPTRHAAKIPVGPETNGDVKLGKGERKILGVLAEFPDGRTQNELAFLAGYSAKASTIGVLLSNLRKQGLVEAGQPIRPTAEGLATVGGPVARPTGQALLEQWLHHPRMGKGERSVLLALVDLYPNVPSNDELCEMTGYSPGASTMGVLLSNLRKLGLVEKGVRRVAPELMEAIS